MLPQQLSAISTPYNTPYNTPYDASSSSMPQ
jgi:hypothetical protein